MIDSVPILSCGHVSVSRAVVMYGITNLLCSIIVLDDMISTQELQRVKRFQGQVDRLNELQLHLEQRLCHSNNVEDISSIGRSDANQHVRGVVVLSLQ